MYSVFERFRESPATSNHCLRASKTIFARFSHSSTVDPAMTSMASSANSTKKDKEAPEDCRERGDIVEIRTKTSSLTRSYIRLPR